MYSTANVPHLRTWICFIVAGASVNNRYYCISNFDIIGDYVALVYGLDETSGLAGCTSHCDAAAGCDHFSMSSVPGGCILKKLAFAGKSSGRTEYTTNVFVSCLQVAVYGTLIQSQPRTLYEYHLHSSAFAFALSSAAKLNIHHANSGTDWPAANHLALTSSDQLYYFPTDAPAAALGPPQSLASPTVYYCITHYDVVGGAAGYGYLDTTATGCASKCSGNPRCDYFVLTTPTPAEMRGCWPKTAAFTGDSGPMHLRLVTVLSCLSVSVYGESGMGSLPATHMKWSYLSRFIALCLFRV